MGNFGKGGGFGDWGFVGGVGGGLEGGGVLRLHRGRKGGGGI